MLNTSDGPRLNPPEAICFTITFPTSKNSCVENYFFHLLILLCFTLLKGSPSLWWIVSELTVHRIKAYSLILSILISCTEQIHRTQLLPLKPITYSGGGVGKGHPLVTESHEEVAHILVSFFLVVSNFHCQKVLCLSNPNFSVLSFWIMIHVLTVSPGINSVLISPLFHFLDIRTIQSIVTTVSTIL